MLQFYVWDKNILVWILIKNQSQEYNNLGNIFANLLPNKGMFSHYQECENIPPTKHPLK